METFASIIDWQTQTFGPATVDRAFDRADEEFEELFKEMIGDVKDRDYRKMAMEAADVIICLSAFMQACGHWDAVDKKMAINRARKWRTNGDGTGYHIPEPEKL